MVTQPEWSRQVSSPERPACTAWARCPPSQVSHGNSQLTREAFLAPSCPVPSQMTKCPLVGSGHSHCLAQPQALLLHEAFLQPLAWAGPKASCTVSSRWDLCNPVSSYIKGNACSSLFTTYMLLVIMTGEEGERSCGGSKPDRPGLHSGLGPGMSSQPPAPG